MRSSKPAPAIAPKSDVDVSAVFQRCLDKPIKSSVDSATTDDKLQYTSEQYGFSVDYPTGFFGQQVTQPTAAAMASTKSGLFTAIIHHPQRGGNLSARDTAFLAKTLKDPFMKVLSREDTMVAGQRAVRYYLEVTHRGKKYCASEVMVVKDGMTYRFSLLQRLLQGRCLGDSVVQKFINGWQWTTS